MNIPNFTFPNWFGKVVSHLPTKPPEMAMALTLNQLIQRQVLPADMAELQGRCFEIVVKDLGMTLRLYADDGKFHPALADQDSDLIFRANSQYFLKMLLREEDPDTLFFNRHLEIEGDTELGLMVKNLLDSIDWSETPFARWVAA